MGRKEKKRNWRGEEEQYKRNARLDRLRSRTESRRLLMRNWSIHWHLAGRECLIHYLSSIFMMLSRTVLPLSRPNVLASVVRTSTLSARPSLYTAHKLSPGIQQRAKSNKANQSKPKTPKASNESIPEQPKVDTKAAPNATEPSGTVST